MPQTSFDGTPDCKERLLLSDEVARAVQRSYKVKTERDKLRANTKSMDDPALESELAEARRAERVAVAALEKHRKEHGC